MEPLVHKTFSLAEQERDRLIKETGNAYIITQKNDLFICKQIKQKDNAGNNTSGEDEIILHPTNKLIFDYIIQLTLALLLFAQSEELTIKIIRLINNPGIYEQATKINSGIAFIGGLVFAIYFLKYLYHVFSKTYYISAESLKLEEGVIAKDIKVICYKDIKTPTLKRTLNNRIFNTGTLEFSASGTSEVDMYFENIDDPKGVLELVLKKIKAL